MPGIHIRAEQFTGEDIKVIKECLKERSREDIVDIVYVAEGDNE